MPANSSIAGIAARVSVRDSPSNSPLMKTFSRPVNSGLNPAPNSSSADTRPLRETQPVVGGRIPARIWRSVLLPEPLGPTMPRVSPGSTLTLMSRKAQKSWCRFLRPNQRASLSRSAGRL